MRGFFCFSKEHQTPKLIDPLQEALKEAREADGEPSAAEVAGKPQARRRTPRKPATAPSVVAPAAPPADASFEEKLKADFRLFLIVIWRHLLKVDPAPIMLDMAYWLQHGPDRSVIMAFRGFSKSWITGAYALWRLYRNPNEQILVLSGALTRAVATTNWCLQLIMALPILHHLRPLPHQRQSSKSFDVGPAVPNQSPSFNAMGIGSQTAGFRASCIIPDDVETQQNSFTATMREKIKDAVKELDSILLPGGAIKYLGTPHDEDSLYTHLSKGGYTIRIWPARYPTDEQRKKYGERLAPYIRHMMEKLGPSCVGRSTMPTRFSDDDLARRELSIGKSEFALQFMLDTSLSDRDKYPLKAKDLIVLSLDPRRGPESVAWSGDPMRRVFDIQSFGLDGDYYQQGVTPEPPVLAPWTRIIGAIDNSGRGADEAALAIVAELHGILFLLHLDARRSGFERSTLEAFAKACVRFNVQRCLIESNFGDGMFAALFAPVLEAEWKKHLEAVNRNRKRGDGEAEGGTEIVEIKASNQANKERRILSVMEPVTQQHRLVVAREVLEWDFASLENIEGAEGRHKYAFGYQFTHLTRDPGALVHDDRLDAVAIGVGDFSDILGVDPGDMAVRTQQDRLDEELQKLLGDDDELGLGVGDLDGSRSPAFLPQPR